MPSKRKWIVNGDKTDHGGTVIASATTATTFGMPFARVGDKVICPKCKVVATIIQGESTMIVMGKPQAYEGCYTSCGAKLVSVQKHTSYFIDGSDHGSDSDAGPAVAAATAAAAPPAKKGVCLECLLKAAERATAVLGR